MIRAISKIMGVFKKGEVVRFDIIGKKLTDAGFSSGTMEDCDKNELRIYQKFFVTNFPSWNDFDGSSTKIKHDSYALVLKSLGVPWKVAMTEDYKDYEVYEVLTSKLSKRCVLAFNIKKAF